ncbi:DUF7344 domain-containing protein [Natronorarus salvus]|uniref:DUF7344 domain-containing protein n=1 Tax=Natronorarus salvus TaxID=3117733 RepID=UPI002F26D5C1
MTTHDTHADPETSIRPETADEREFFDGAFSVLANGRRRHALSVLREHGTVSLADLADEVAVRERSLPLAEIPAEAVADLYMTLYHRHVPLLAEEGFVEYDQETDTVRGTESVPSIDPYLDTEGED